MHHQVVRWQFTHHPFTSLSAHKVLLTSTHQPFNCPLTKYRAMRRSAVQPRSPYCHPCYRGLSAPPKKNTILGSSRFVGLCWCRISKKKKVRFSPPADGPPGEKNALFYKKRREHGPKPGTSRKNGQKQGYFVFGPFLGILGILGQNDEVPGLLDSKVLKKTVHHPYGATSDALLRVYFVSSVSLLPKYTLWRASEVAP